MGGGGRGISGPSACHKFLLPFFTSNIPAEIFHSVSSHTGVMDSAVASDDRGIQSLARALSRDGTSQRK